MRPLGNLVIRPSWGRCTTIDRLLNSSRLVSLTMPGMPLL